LSDTYVGWTVGAGLEYAFTNNLIGRIEYRYTDYGDETHPPSIIVPHTDDLQTSDVHLGVSYKL
jgi:outer membrane immunogenic protein